MFSLSNFKSIEHHLRSISRIYKSTSGGKWIQIFCPYCDDAVRKHNPKHGHCYISNEYPFFICFRCNKSGNLLRFLNDTNFTDASVINKLKSYSSANIKYSLSSEYKHKLIDYKQYIIEKHVQFSNTYPDDYNKVLDYIFKRCLHINPIYFGICPTYVDNNLAIEFINHSGNACGNRLISNSNLRYKNVSKDYYYFQDILQLIDYTEVVICEGAIDLINLYNYSTFPKTAFYIAVGGSFFSKLIRYLINNYLLIGHYKLHIVFDNFYKFENNLIRSIKYTINSLNPEIQYRIYKPIIGKDVSDCMKLKRIK